MKIKAIHKNFGNGKCIIKPVFFPYNVGLGFKVVKGDHENSFFCCNEQDFYFSFKAKIQLIFIHIAYWIVKWFWWRIWRYYPAKIKNFIKGNKWQSWDI